MDLQGNGADRDDTAHGRSPAARRTGLPSGTGAAQQAGREGDAGSRELSALMRRRVADAGGWLPFDQFMALALYAPGLGYYASGRQVFGSMPGSGSDFVTAPELSPLFGATLAQQVAQVLEAGVPGRLLEFGAGSGALAEQLLTALGERVQEYAIVDLSGSLRARQAERLARFAPRVRWLDALPDAVHGVVLGNEVLDAMPVQLLVWDGSQWLERGVALAPGADDRAAGAGGVGSAAGAAAANGAPMPTFAWADRPTPLRPPLQPQPAYAPGTVVEIAPQAQAFIRSLADRLQHGAAFFIDYGFPEAELYHPQRTGGTLMCHRGHRADTDPLADVGSKDITAHVDFTAIALAGQDAGLDVLGYTSQAHFLLNCGIAPRIEQAPLRARADAGKLLLEHEMGELFKVIGFARGLPGFRAIGFAAGDRSHRL